jgi:hypothetical protein
VCENRDTVEEKHSLKVMIAREDKITPIGQYGEISAVQVSEEARGRFRVVEAWKITTERRTLMSRYYVGLDVHKASISIAVLNASGKLVTESVVETSAATVLDFFKGLRGQVGVTFEEGTHAAWLYDVLKQTKAGVVVCDPRKNRLLRDGNKSDKVDARKLAQLLRAGLLSPVYHGEQGVRDLKELVRSYEYLVEDSTRTMNRINALYRARAIRPSRSRRRHKHAVVVSAR